MIIGAALTIGALAALPVVPKTPRRVICLLIGCGLLVAYTSRPDGYDIPAYVQYVTVGADGGSAGFGGLVWALSFALSDPRGVIFVIQLITYGAGLLAFRSIVALTPLYAAVLYSVTPIAILGSLNALRQGLAAAAILVLYLELSGKKRTWAIGLLSCLSASFHTSAVMVCVFLIVLHQYFRLRNVMLRAGLPEIAFVCSSLLILVMACSPLFLEYVAGTLGYLHHLEASFVGDQRSTGLLRWLLLACVYILSTSVLLLYQTVPSRLSRANYVRLMMLTACASVAAAGHDEIAARLGIYYFTIELVFIAIAIKHRKILTIVPIFAAYAVAPNLRNVLGI